MPRDNGEVLLPDGTRDPLNTIRTREEKLGEASHFTEEGTEALAAELATRL